MSTSTACLWLSIAFFCFCAWITHIIHCLFAAKYLLLIAGGIIPPIGIIHGVGIWFGASW